MQATLVILLLGGLGLALYLVWPEVQLVGKDVYEFLRYGTRQDVEAWWVCFAAGLVRMGYLRFFAATSLGLIPLTVLVACLGADITRLQDGLLWISIASVLLFVAYVAYDWMECSVTNIRRRS